MLIKAVEIIETIFAFYLRLSWLELRSNVSEMRSYIEGPLDILNTLELWAVSFRL